MTLGELNGLVDRLRSLDKFVDELRIEVEKVAREHERCGVSADPIIRLTLDADGHLQEAWAQLNLAMKSVVVGPAATRSPP